jgi:hypothetical protein
MKAMLGISMELEKSTEQVLLGSTGEGKRGWWQGGRGQGREMTQTMYVHVNK